MSFINATVDVVAPTIYDCETNGIYLQEAEGTIGKQNHTGYIHDNNTAIFAVQSSLMLISDLDITDNVFGVYITASSGVDLLRCDISDNDKYAVYYYNSQGHDISYSNITGNSTSNYIYLPSVFGLQRVSTAVVYNAAPDCSIEYSNIYGNATDQVYPHEYQVVNITPIPAPPENLKYNYWGTTDSAVIEAITYDGRDNASFTTIDYSGYVSVPY